MYGAEMIHQLKINTQKIVNKHQILKRSGRLQKEREKEIT